MDTNSIQPTKNELATVNTSFQLSVFQKEFLKLTELGVWPVAITNSFLVSSLLIGIPCYALYGDPGGAVWISLIGVSSGFISSISWWILSFCKCPEFPKISISLWTPLFLCLIIRHPLYPLIDISWSAYIRVELIMYVLPAIVGGFSSILSYKYKEDLRRRTAESSSLLLKDKLEL